MGSMRCERTDCGNAMCSRILRLDDNRSGEFYICNNCYDELLLCKEKWPKVMTEIEIKQSILAFLHSKIGTYIQNRPLSQEEIDEVFNHLCSNNKEMS